VSQTDLTKSVAIREEPARDLAVTTEGGPVVAAEVELKPLAPRPQLLPAVADALTITPAVAAGGWRWLFVFTVVLPMAAAAAYLLAVATPRFNSTASFVVRATVQQSDNPLAALAADSSSSIARDETNAVNAYLTSRDVVDQLVKNNGLRAILDRSGADFLFRYPTFWLPNNNEYLYQRFQWMADAEVDPITSISTIDVNAFTAEDARAIASAMLGYAEALVNQMNERAYKDGVANAEQSVTEAQRQFDGVEQELRAYRNETGSVDPNLVAGSKLKVIEGLSTELAEVEATIAQQTSIAPNTPSLKGLRAQAESYRKEIDKRKLEIAGSVGSEAAKLEGYEKLVLQRELAGKALAVAEAERTQARQDAERQHLYVQLISRPNLSTDFAKYPRATLDLLVLLAICLGIFQVLRLLGGITAEHHA
jgi:capsular polysaccharide transport system permease protein